jgi:hypothetical protein
LAVLALVRLRPVELLDEGDGQRLKTMEKEIISIKGQRYIVVDRKVKNSALSPGELYAELLLQKPNGAVSYAADETFEGMHTELTGIPFLDEGVRPLPKFKVTLRPDREVNQGDLERKIQPKSPCCNRTMREMPQVPGRIPRRFCRKCDKEVYQ